MTAERPPNFVVKNLPLVLQIHDYTEPAGYHATVTLPLERVCPHCGGSSLEPEAADETLCAACFDPMSGKSHGVVPTPQGRAIQAFLLRWGTVKP